jgi:hypothetical protein
MFGGRPKTFGGPYAARGLRVEDPCVKQSNVGGKTSGSGKPARRLLGAHYRCGDSKQNNPM